MLSHYKKRYRVNWNRSMAGKVYRKNGFFNSAYHSNIKFNILAQEIHPFEQTRFAIVINVLVRIWYFDSTINFHLILVRDILYIKYGFFCSMYHSKVKYNILAYLE